MTITITHTYADGTLLHGTTREETRKGTPVREALQQNAWRWKPSHDAWGQLSSADKPARKYRIDSTAAALRELGYDVTIEINNIPRNMATAESERAEHMDARVDALNARADRRASEARAREDAARQTLDNIPLGQPLLVGHHSYARDKKRRERAWANYEKSLDLERKSRYHSGRAETASKHMDHRYNPQTVARRVERLKTEVRSMNTNGGNPDYRAMRENELAYWEQVREQQLATGDALSHSQDTIKKGDIVQVSGMHCRVVRANKQTVTVDYDMSHHRVPYHDITKHIPAE